MTISEYTFDENNNYLSIVEIVRKRGLCKDFMELNEKYGSLPLSKKIVNKYLSMSILQILEDKQIAFRSIKNNGAKIENAIKIAGARVAINILREAIGKKISMLSEKLFGHIEYSLIHPSFSYCARISPQYTDDVIYRNLNKLSEEREKLLSYIKYHHQPYYNEIIKLREKLDYLFSIDAEDEINQDKEIQIINKVLERYIK